jgi:hypothetical protein
MDLFGRPLVDLDEWKKSAKEGKGANDVALLKSYAGVFDIEKAEGDAGEGQIRIRITTGSRDRDRDTIAAAGWEIGNYLKNPVVLWAHLYRELPIARDAGLTIDANGIVGTPVFTAQDENPFGYMCGRLVRGKFLNAASIGMLPMTWTYNEAERGVDFQTQELLEWSLVPVPANPEALVVARSKGIDIAPLKSWAEQLLDQYHGEPVIALPRKSVERAWQIVSGNPVTINLKSNVTVTVTGDNADDVKAAREQIEAAMKGGRERRDRRALRVPGPQWRSCVSGRRGRCRRTWCRRRSCCSTGCR